MKLGETNSAIGSRDAIHVPCIVARSYGGFLRPGIKVRFTNTDYNEVEECDDDTYHGVIDPFLDGSEREGFLVLLKPSLVTGLSHNFDFSENDIDPDGIGCGKTCGQ